MTDLRKKYRPSDDSPLSQILQREWDRMPYEHIYSYSKEFEKIDEMMEKEYKKLENNC